MDPVKEARERRLVREAVAECHKDLDRAARIMREPRTDERAAEVDALLARAKERVRFLTEGLDRRARESVN